MTTSVKLFAAFTPRPEVQKGCCAVIESTGRYKEEPSPWRRLRAQSHELAKLPDLQEERAAAAAAMRFDEMA